MTFLVRDRTKIVVFFFVLVVTSSNLSLDIGKCNANYKEVDVTSRYDGYIINNTRVDLECVASIETLQDNYTVIFNHTKMYDNTIDDMMYPFMICTIESIAELPRYTIGVKHSFWFTRDAVYNDSNDLLLVYDINTMTLLYMNGQVHVNGSEVFAFIIMTGFVADNNLSDPFTLLFWMIGIIAVCAIVGLMVYVFALRKKIQTRKQVKSAKKSGRKMDDFKKEVQERKNKVLKKQEKQEEKEMKKKKSSESKEK